MTQEELLEVCPVCDDVAIFMFSGSGRKAVCEDCLADFEVTYTKMGKSFRRLEFDYDYD